MTGFARRGFVAVTAVVAGLVLAGCNGGDDPPTTTSGSTTTNSSTPTPSTSTTSTAPPTTTTPTTASTGIPDAAKQRTPEGAVAFVNYFETQHARAWQLPDPGALSPLCTDKAATCIAYGQAAQTLKDKGQHLDRPPIEVSRVSDLGTAGSGRRVLLEGRQTAGKIINGDGTTDSVVPAKSVAFVFEVQWMSGWKISSIKVAA